MSAERPAWSLTSKASAFLEAVKKSLSPTPKYLYGPGNDDTTPPTGLLQDIRKLGFKDYETLLSFLNASVTGIQDDGKLLLESLIQLLAKLPPHSKQGKQLSDGFATMLWNDLDHPPTTSLAPELRYRSADGSHNNIRVPKLGAANTAYARTTAPVLLQNPNQPDPGLVFDMVMARGGTFEPHPQRLSSMFTYLATLITHDLFQTSSADYSINLTSSYLDLAPLYGRNEQELRAMRLFRDGLIKPDCFSSKRILGFPAGCCVFLVMFNRFHNYVATQLALINQNNRFARPPAGMDAEAAKAAWAKRDEDLFQTGRLVTCGLYANILIKDYVRTILALNRSGSAWNLDPRIKEGKTIFSQPAPQAVGNQVSVEFNLLYRFHPMISRRDETWTADQFRTLLGGGDGRDPAHASVSEMVEALGRFEGGLPDEPERRTFAGLQRSPADGTFDDDSLVGILREAIEDVAGAFGANRIPDCMRSIEMLGIIQSRA